MALRSILMCVTLCFCVGVASAQTPYEALIQQGNTQLAHNAEQALASAQAAIKLDSKRWEAYLLAGGALMNLRRYDEAIDNLSKAIDLAPAEKQAALRDLRKQCVLAESGAASPPAQPVAAAPAQPATTTQAEIVLWESIKTSQQESDFKAYLSQYPNGAFVVLAKQHISDLETQAEQQRQQQVAAEDTKMKQEQQRLATAYSVQHYVVGFGSNFRQGLFHLVPDGVEYQTTKEQGFQAKCSEITGLQLTSSYRGHPLEITVGGKKYVFYPGDRVPGAVAVTPTDLMTVVAEHCGITPAN